MVIFICILSAILLLIITLLLLPVHIFIKKDNEEGFTFKIKIWFVELAGDDSEDKKASKNIKKVFGLKKNHPTEKPKEPFTDKVSRYLALIKDVITAASSVIKKITVQRFFLNIVCAEEDAADTAISYGSCCAIVLPIVSAVNSITKIKKDAESINISCDYTSQKGRLDFDLHFTVRLYALLSALIRFGKNRIKRKKY